MRVKISFEVPEQSVLDYNYQYALGSAIYRAFEKADPTLAREVNYHKGFKFFTFSNMNFSNYKPLREGLQISGPGWFVVSSPRNDLIEAIVTGSLFEPGIKLPGVDVMITSIEVLPPPKIGERVRMRTLSPVIVTTKRDTPEGAKTWDLMPHEPGFYANIRRNLHRKYREFYGREGGEFDIIGIERTKVKRIRMKSGYFETYHRAVHMHFTARGDRDMILFALDTGLGEKNSMGFGCVEVLE